MSKFKKGDIVRITAKERQPGWNRAGKMDKYIGMLVEVVDVMLDGVEFLVYSDADDYPWVFKSKEAELVYRPSDHSDRYEDGLNDAWEAAKRIVLHPQDGGYSCEDFENIFGMQSCSEVFKKCSPQEVVEKIEGYKQAVKYENARKKTQDLINRFGMDSIYGIVREMSGEKK